MAARMARRAGILRVTPMVAGVDSKDVMRDFNAEEWSYKWVPITPYYSTLRVQHDNSDEDSDSFEYIEFSSPVHIEFIPED